MQSDHTQDQVEFTGWKRPLIGAQMLFVAFGALVLVPLLTGLNPNVALFTAGAGTLIFQLITRRKVPVFLASSFAFIAPIIYGTETFGLPGTMCGLMAAGLLYAVLSGVIALRGPDIVSRYLPPLVTGPVIIVIGLNLAPVAVNMALGRTGDGSAELFPVGQALTISMLALVVTLVASVFGRSLFRLIPIFCGIAAGYITALIMGIVSFQPVIDATWIGMPAFTFPEWNLQAVLFMIPVAIAPAVEHIGDVVAIGGVTGKDYVKNPGLHRTMLGDGIATSFAAMLGGPPNTTYSEVTGAVALTRAFDPAIMTWAACTAIILGFVGKLGALLQTIPSPVMGGIMVLLFGAIASIGMSSLIRAKIDLSVPRNMAIVAITLVFGIGGMVFNFGEFAMQGIGLSAVVAILLNIVLPEKMG
jgi:uracil permease|nr:uracil-xanthine permease family protein [Candidatus Krumholzibacteria bacterium]